MNKTLVAMFQTSINTAEPEDIVAFFLFSRIRAAEERIKQPLENAFLLFLQIRVAHASLLFVGPGESVGDSPPPRYPSPTCSIGLPTARTRGIPVQLIAQAGPPDAEGGSEGSYRGKPIVLQFPQEPTGQMVGETRIRTAVPGGHVAELEFAQKLVFPVDRRDQMVEFLPPIGHAHRVGGRIIIPPSSCIESLGGMF
jgi:hypothetical protein